MPLSRTLANLTLVGVLTLAAAGNAVAADRKTTNTLLGAGLGAAAGAVLSQGDPLLTIGGAAAGGVLGNVLTEEPRRHRHYRSYGPRYDHGYYGNKRYVSKHYKKNNGWRGHRHHRHR